LIRIGLRCPVAVTIAAERVSVCVLAGLTLISLTAAVEGFRLTIHTTSKPVRALTTEHSERRMIARVLVPATAPRIAAIHSETVEPVQPAPMNTRSIRAAGKVPRAPTLPGQTPEDVTKTSEPPKMTRMLSPARDMDYGEADRSVSAPSVIVIGRQKNLPMLRDDRAFETWGGEFAGGDSRLKEIIQAGALTSVERGAKVRVLEVRGALTHIEVTGQGRTGWIRSASLGR
jgi:hypothetical protein